MRGPFHLLTRERAQKPRGAGKRRRGFSGSEPGGGQSALLPDSWVPGPQWESH